MKPVFAVQITGRSDADLQLTVDALDASGLEWINFGIIPFTDEITNLEAFPTDRPVIPLAGCKLVDMHRRGKTPPNWKIYYEQRLFDQCYTRLGGIHHYMLNRSARIYNYERSRDVPVDQDMFVKPSNDLKVFAGCVLPAGTTLDQMLETITHQEISRGEQIVFAPVRNIGAEYRLFIVNNHIVDGSEYKRNGQVGAKKIDTRAAFDLGSFFQTVKRFTYGQNGHPPPLVYCMDVVEVEDNPYSRYEIVEFNCFHASGMYKVDRGMVLQEVAACVGTHHG